VPQRLWAQYVAVITAFTERAAAFRPASIKCMTSETTESYAVAPTRTMSFLASSPTTVPRLRARHKHDPGGQVYRPPTAAD
jgi:hypothetical protein